LDQPQNPNHPDPVTPPPATPAPGREQEAASRERQQAEVGEAAAAPPPMTPVAWLLNNGPYLVVLGALVAWGLHKVGPEGVWHITLGILGLGFLIFVHELGHFVTAKWCDVHVQTFSIGFGPALPGCSFQRGETTYKIGVIPLGGYVNMVGEGPEADEDENYPRSFKNKTVGQRMLIISAGVIMNVLVAGILFVLVFIYHGDYRPAGIVGAVDPGSPAWNNGVRSGMVIANLDNTPNPSFNDLRVAVVLSGPGERIPFLFQTPGGPELKVDLLPRRDESDLNPVIGVSASNQLKLPEDPRRATAIRPVVADSAAAAARPLGLKPGARVLATTDPDHPDQLLDLPQDLAGRYQELARRLKRLEGQKLVLRLRPAAAVGPTRQRGEEGAEAKEVEREVPLEGFAWGDSIVGTSKPPEVGASYDPLVVEELPRDPRHSHEDRRDPFAYHRRLQQLVGLPMIIQVRREGAPAGSPPVDLFVPPAYHWTLGMRMKMGEIAALRDGSPAAKAGLKKGDLLVKVVLQNDKGEALLTLGAKDKDDLDPERLPDQLRQAARQTPGPKQVVLTVRRPASNLQEIALPAATWDDSWDGDIEEPLSAAALLPIPQLGLAYRIESRIAHIEPGGPADKAHLEDKDGTLSPLLAGDRIDEMRFRTWAANYQDSTWDNRIKLGIPRSGEKVYDGWARILPLLQAHDHKSVLLTITRPNGEVKNPVVVQAREEETWPLVSRGLRLQPDFHLQKANSFGQALAMGTRKTVGMIKLLYLQLRSLATGRVSTEQVGGPIEMGAQAFAVASMGYWELLGFLGVISINLAVVNFLPIPVLDGGHMVFLIYEKLRGRPPSESVRIVATYIGLAAIGCLMIFVFYQDIRKHIFGL
jgi:membrane-associated protease RseP (regulator of RpoE activity)